jgi:hypothetical protein
MGAEMFTVQERKRREDNARKAKMAATRLFPDEQWIFVEDGIYLSPRRPIGEKTNYKDELRDARILRDAGSTVYLCPENRYIKGRKYDAIVNGVQMEFKNMGGNVNTLQSQFFKSRSQAPNVFINLETSDITKSEATTALYGARNNPRYAQKNKFDGGSIILKIQKQQNLVYLNVDDLKI